MNERIKQLVEQATELKQNTVIDPVTYTMVPSQTYRRELNAEKFAELIVLEMCNVLDKAQWDKGQDWVCADGTRIIPQIKQHFGVEE